MYFVNLEPNFQEANQPIIDTVINNTLITKTKAPKLVKCLQLPDSAQQELRTMHVILTKNIGMNINLRL